MKSAFFVSILLIFLAKINCLTTTPTFQVTNKYIETGSYSLDTSSYYANSSMSGVEWLTFSVSYANNHSSYTQAQLSFQNLNFQYTSSLIANVTVLISSLQISSLNANLMSNRLNQIQTLQIRYLVLDSGFSKLVIFDDYQITLNYKLNASAPRVTIISSYPAMDMSGTVRCFLVWSGLNTTVNNTNDQFNIQTTAAFTSSTTLKITIQTLLTNNQRLYGLSFGLICYNEEAVASWPFPAARLNYGDFVGIGSSASFSDSLNVTQSYNTFWGFNEFSMSNQSFLQFESIFIPQISLDCGSSNPFLSVAFSMLAFEFKECDSSTPYYLISQDRCYDTCPPRYSDDSSLYNCSSCAYDCYQCLFNAGLCTVCNATTDFRTLDNATGRCLPISKYYDDGTNNSTAQPCDPSCQNCTGTSTYCTSCLNGTFLSNNSCSGCIPHCSVCNSAVTCQTCQSSYTYQNSSCISGCSSINYCTVCHISANQTLCDTCSLGYQVSTNNCLPVCGDGVVIAPEECDDGNNLNGDGCSSSCLFEDDFICSIVSNTSNCFKCSKRTYADSTHQNCVPCSNYVCLTCKSTGQCLSCSPSDFRTLNINNSQCVPIDKYYDDGSNSTALPCDSNCQTCSGSSNSSCLSCSDGNALDNSSCINCDAASGTVGCKTCVKTKVTFSCLSCFTGSLSSGICSSSDSSPSSQSSSNNNTILLAILLPVMVTLLAAGVISFVIYKRHVHAQNMVEQQQKGQQTKVETLQVENNTSKQIDFGQLKINSTEQSMFKMQSVKLSKKFQQINQGNNESIKVYQKLGQQLRMI